MENGYSYEWINGQKPHLIKDGIRIICNTENFVPIVVPSLVKFVLWIFINFKDTCKTRESFFFLIVLHPHLLHLQYAKCRFKKGKMHLTVTSLQCQCLNLLMIGQGRPDETQANETPKTKIKKETTIERRNLCDDPEIPEWLQEFRENLVDDETPVQGDSHASSSHEAS